MSKLSDQIHIDASAAEVWRVVGVHFDGIGDWATAIPASTANLGADGVTPAPITGRTCQTGLRWLPATTETIVAYDDAARTLTYEAQDMPTFVAVARNRWVVTSEGAQGCRVSYDAVFETRGVLGRLTRPLIVIGVRRTGRHTLDDLKQYVQRGVPSPRKQRRLRKAEVGRV
jgi:hypothetical protein